MSFVSVAHLTWQKWQQGLHLFFFICIKKEILSSSALWVIAAVTSKMFTKLLHSFLGIYSPASTCVLCSSSSYSGGSDRSRPAPALTGWNIDGVGERMKQSLDELGAVFLFNSWINKKQTLNCLPPVFGLRPVTRAWRKLDSGPAASQLNNLEETLTRFNCICT